MTVRVDELKVWPHARHACFKRGSAHLTADTLEELHAFAARLGLRRAWFQPRSWPHYDLSPAKHVQALALGAVLVPARVQAEARMRARQLPGNCGACGQRVDHPEGWSCEDCGKKHESLCQDCVCHLHMLMHA